MNDDVVKSKPLILGTAVKYNWEQIAPFVLSCKKHVPDGKIVLFVSDIDRQTIEALQKENVEVIIDSFNVYSNFVGWKLAYHQLSLKLSILFAKLIVKGSKSHGNEPYVNAFASVVVQRFYRYLRYLHAYGHNYSHVLMADTRDVIFQDNPFPLNGLHVFGEKNEKIGESHFAKRWFQLSYGTRTWKELGEKPLLNVGTTLGDTKSIIDYLSMIASEFNRTLTFFWGADTSVHNYVIYKKFSNPIVNEFGEGAVLTLHGLNSDQLNVKNGKILNYQGLPYPILHQYDRVKNLKLNEY